MRVFRGLEGFQRPAGPVHLALGMFDGVHLGHQAVLGRARDAAAADGGRSVVLTFDPHPQRILAPPPEPILLTTIEERLRLFEALGSDDTVIITFDHELRDVPAGEWLARIEARLAPSAIYVSADHAFGRDREGTVARLAAAGGEMGFRVEVIPPVHVAGTVVSSSLVRRLVRAGQVADAATYLGRWYSVRGSVVEGERRGRTLGFPTANLAVDPDKVLPGKGIYAAWARLEEEGAAWVQPGGVSVGSGAIGVETGAWRSAVSVGTRPTFGPGALRVEAHILDFGEDLYGTEIELMFVCRLRDEMAFHTIPELIQNMEQDVRRAREVLSRPPDVPPRVAWGGPVLE